MNIRVFAKSVQGASHIRQGIICQDSNYWCKKLENAAVVAVADGHGSSKCTYSDEGSYRAVHAFCDIMQEIVKNYNGDKESLKPLIDENKLLAKRITSLWRKRVARKHSIEHREKLKIENNKTTKKKTSIGNVIDKANQTVTDFMLYGTTLLGIAIVEDIVLVYQLGDGDIQLVSPGQVTPLVDADKFLGVETYSLANAMSWNYAKITVIELDKIDKPFLIMMSTDGLSNSYTNNEEFCKCSSDYFEIIRDEGFPFIERNLESWLRETSDNGCGDDITVALAYITD